MMIDLAELRRRDTDPRYVIVTLGSKELLELLDTRFPNLLPVIEWLENGCDPKEAAKELRIYQQRMSLFDVVSQHPRNDGKDKERT